MDTWWFYEMPNAQAAFDSVVELILNYSRSEWAGAGVVSREGSDDRDHLYLFVWSVDPTRRSRRSKVCSTCTVADRRSPSRSYTTPKGCSSTDPATA